MSTDPARHESPYPLNEIVPRLEVIEHRVGRHEEHLQRVDERLMEGSLALARLATVAESLDEKTGRLVRGQEYLQETVASFPWKLIGAAAAMATVISVAVGIMLATS